MKIPIKVVTESKEQTQNFAFEFAKMVTPFALIAFFGDLGAGKTAFVSGFARRFGVEDLVSSPTFSIMNEYYYDEGSKLKIVHCDMYRITTQEDLYTTGFFDLLNDDRVILLVEWSEKIKEFLHLSYYSVDIKILGERKREIKITKKEAKR